MYIAHHADQISTVIDSYGGGSPDDIVRRSWRRSAMSHRLDPNTPRPPTVLTLPELRPRQENRARMIEAAQTELDRLYALIQPRQYIVLLADQDGVVIDHRGEAAEDTRHRVRGAWLGGVWTEALEGTNGIGTCIAERGEVTVHKAEYYRTQHVDLSCAGAPVFDDRDELQGVVCVASIDPELSEHAHGLSGALAAAAAAARAIEERLFRGKFRHHWILALRDPTARRLCMLIAVDRDRRIIGADRAGRAILKGLGVPLGDQPGLWPSLWTMFEQDKDLFWHNDPADRATALTAHETGIPWQAIVTPPPEAGPRLSAEMAHFHMRPRLDTLGAGRMIVPAPAVRGGLPPAIVGRLRDYIDGRLDQTINLRALAAEARLSAYHFARAFKQSGGVTPRHFVLERRLAKARELLVRGGLSLSQIAAAVGFADQSHFTRRFRDLEGISPGQFRRLRQETDTSYSSPFSAAKIRSA
jgi:AraC-like DNA-binding protein